jgi:ankyrin repeat protein
MNKIMEEELKDIVAKGDLVQLKKIFNAQKLNSKITNDLLVGATILGFTDIVIYLLDNGVSADSKDENGDLAALHYAADKCRIEIAKELLKRGANINIMDLNGNTPIGNAIFKRKKCPEMLKLFIEKGADINLKNKHGVSAKELAEGFDLDLENL